MYAELTLMHIHFMNTCIIDNNIFSDCVCIVTK